MAASTISPAEQASSTRGGATTAALQCVLANALALVAAGAGLLPDLAQAARYEAEVLHVTDGDTVLVRPLRGGAALRVRIEGIDAPELCQTGGRAAREALAGRVLHRRVRLDTRGRDDWGRTVARLHLGTQDVGGWMVAQGQAWSYRFRGRRGPYHAAEVQARWERRGLWAQPRPEEPRRFRQRHGPCEPGSMAP